MAADFPEKFKNTMELVTWAKANGWRLEKSTAYGHAKKGLLRVQSDKSILGVDAKVWLLAMVGRESGDAADLGAEKMQLEIRNLEIKAQKSAFELDQLKGKYLPRADFERELAGRAIVLESGLRRMFAAQAARMIALVSGKAEKTPELTAFLNGTLDDLLRTYASTETYQVMVLPGTAEAENQEEEADHETD
ncbi:hypothetical protein [Desulfobotulus sp.]|uniref:hypothetical protein n=1 Tax=Desulfobotulus sp. TaxID=1940337 RepID=UPI002A36A90C|nr:hypothetical protein [Desulfobotulus sp.]MDY0164871.1 hypothetical protein [Desulfobotulus sp.]